MEELSLLSKKLQEIERQIVKEITNEQNYNNGSGEVLGDELIKIRSELVHILAGSLLEDKEWALKNIEKWAVKTGERAIQLNIPMDETLKSTKIYRTYIWTSIRKIVEECDLSRDTVFEASSLIDPLLDEAVHVFSLSYIKYHEEVLYSAKNEFLELSAPIVKIFDDIAIMPLIGDIDTYRAQIILNKALEEANQLNLSNLVIDLSGVTIVDTAVAQEIIMISNSLKLLGTKVTLTGIRSDVAQTMIHLGIDLPNIETEGSLQKAMKNLMQ